MKIGIISDTHDGLTNAGRAVEVFGHQKVSFILHAGDIESGDIAQMFAGIKGAKLIAVYGNCDTQRAELTEAITSFGGEINEIYDGQIDGKRIFMAHRPELAQGAVESGKFDLVIHGHTHKLDIRKVGRTLIVNPGTARRWQMGHPHVVVVELAGMSAEAITLI
jgi:putative phosphoesterase